MSILLSPEQLHKIYRQYRLCTVSENLAELSKAAAIHAVQYLEAPCSEFHSVEGAGARELYHDKQLRIYYQHRYDCPDCMAKVYEELGI